MHPLRVGLQLLLVVVTANAYTPFAKNASSNVVTMNEVTWQHGAIEDKNVWLVAIYQSRDTLKSPELVKVFEGVATKVKGILKVGAVDLDTPFGKALAEKTGIPVEGAPHVFCLPSTLSNPPGADGAIQAIPYQGNLKVDPLARFGFNMLPSLAVKQLSTEKDKQKFFDTHTTESLGVDVPKAVLFTDKDSTPPLWKGLSVSFLNRLHFGEVRASKNPDLAAEYGVTKYPSVLVIPTQEGADPVKYEGASFGVGPISDFLEEHAVPQDVVDELLAKKQEEHEEKIKQAEAEKAEAKKQEEINQQIMNLNPTQRLHTSELWKEEVMDKAGISLVAFLDPSESYHKEYLRTLKKAWRRIQKGGTKIRFNWVDGTQQHGLANYFGAAGNMPACVFMNPQKGWWKFMIGSFEETKIWAYSREQLLKGGGKAFDGIPEFAEETNEQGLQELDEEEEAALLNPDSAKTKAKKEATKAPAKPKPKTKKQLKDAEEIEARNKAREEEKAAARKANEEKRRLEREEREAKIQAEKDKKKKKKKKEKKENKGKKSTTLPAAFDDAEVFHIKTTPEGLEEIKPKSVKSSNPYVEAMKARRAREEL